MKSSLSIVLIAFFGVSMGNAALADEPARHNCVQPPVPAHFASDNAVKAINKKTEIYKDCINKFAKEQQEISQTTTDVAKANAAHDAGEAAMQEFNDYIKLRNKKNEEE